MTASRIFTAVAAGVLLVLAAVALTDVTRYWVVCDPADVFTDACIAAMDQPPVFGRVSVLWGIALALSVIAVAVSRGARAVAAIGVGVLVVLSPVADTLLAHIPYADEGLWDYAPGSGTIMGVGIGIAGATLLWSAASARVRQRADHPPSIV